MFHQIKEKERQEFQKERNQCGRQKEGIPKTIAKRTPWMTAVHLVCKTSPDQSKRSACSRRDRPKTKMDLRGNLI